MAENNKKMITNFEGKYRFLSNFSDIPVIYDGRVCASAESAFQMMKTLDLKLREQIAEAKPSQAKSLGRRVKLRSDWEEIKDQIMYEIIYSKFSKYENMKQKLLDTGNAILVEENDWGDTYWGICDGLGENKLGSILMRVRHELRTKKEENE